MRVFSIMMLVRRFTVVGRMFHGLAYKSVIAETYDKAEARAEADRKEGEELLEVWDDDGNLFKSYGLTFSQHMARSQVQLDEFISKSELQLEGDIEHLEAKHA